MIRQFREGVYTHYKEGTRYLAYEDTTDEATQLPRISYFALDKPEKKWNREVEIFMAPADPNPKINKTGQEWKFEFLSNECLLFERKEVPLMPQELLVATAFAFSQLHLGDTIRIVQMNDVGFTGTVEGISRTGVIVDTGSCEFSMKWSSTIKELYKIYGGN
jgi:hypothetical protein